MRQQEVLQAIAKYFSRFKEQVNILNANGEFAINIHAENVLIKILNIVFECNLENVNYVEGKNYDSIDLRDTNKGLSIQVTSTSNIKKIKDTLKGYTENEHYNVYSILKVLVLTGRQERYSQDSLDKIIEGKYSFKGSVDIIDFTTLYVLLNKQNDLSKMLAVKELLEAQFSDILEAGKYNDIQLFKDLCKAIKPYFEENGRIFKKFGPNSGADVKEPLRWNLTLWYKARREKLLPNNKIVSTLINEYVSLIPEEHKELFDEFQSHAYAFEKHCEDAGFDYTMYQFPKRIVDVINQVVGE